MAGLEARFKALHDQLRTDYRQASGRRAYCVSVAFELGNLLVAAGRPPRFYAVTSIPEVGATTVRPIRPIPYGGNLIWSHHVVCTSGGRVYDPMLPEPLTIREYPRRAFSEEVVLSVLNPNDTEHMQALAEIAHGKDDLIKVVARNLQLDTR